MRTESVGRRSSPRDGFAAACERALCSQTLFLHPFVDTFEAHKQVFPSSPLVSSRSVAGTFTRRNSNVIQILFPFATFCLTIVVC